MTARSPRSIFRRLPLALAGLLLLAGAPALLGQVAPADTVNITIGTGAATGKETLSTSLQVLLLFTVLSLAPSILVMTTSFVRISIVLGFLRQALGLQQPSNQVVIALSLFLTFFIMAPTFEAVNREALAPLREGTLPADAAIAKAGDQMKVFMLKFTRESEMRLFIDLARVEQPYASAEEVPLRIVIPAFMLSELKTAFQMGLLILLPFLVIDLVVSSVLMSLGMMMLPPTMIALPLKLMVFVLADGWTLIVRALVASFGQ